MLRSHVLRLFRRLGITYVYETGVGMKVINPIDLHRCIPGIAGDVVGEMPPERLLIGFDGLRDVHTNLGVPVPSSAHFGLMQALARGEELGRTEYARRLERGTLDWRPPTPFTEAVRDRLRTAFAERLQQLRAGTLPPITVIVLGGALYVADGKHRAALCVLEGKPHPCVDVTALLHDSAFRYRCYFRLQRNESEYRRHLDLLRPFYSGLVHPTLGACS